MQSRLLSIFIIIFCQNLAGQDTLKLSKNYLKLRFTNYFSFGENLYIIGDDTVNQTTYIKFRELRDSLKKVFDDAEGKYCIFYNSDSSVIEEGIWKYEYFIGPYKGYFRNGSLRIKGNFTDKAEDLAKYKGGIKVGKWEYFNEEGELIREEYYDALGSIIKQRKFNIKDKFKLDIKRNIYKGTANFYLFKNSVVSDSFALEHIDFTYDSLVNFNERTWLYIYSIQSSCAPSISSNKYQILFSVKSGKLTISLICLFEFARPKSEKDKAIVIDSSSQFYNLKSNFAMFNHMTLDSDFVQNKTLGEVFVCQDCNQNGIEGVEFSKSHILKYDSIRAIYYNKIRILNGDFLFESEIGFFQKVALKNKKVFFLQFYWDAFTSFAYYEGKWYFQSGTMFRPLNNVLKMCD